MTGNYDGTLGNGATFAPGVVGQAFSFDGVDDLVTTPLVVDYTHGVTFDLWVQTSDGTNSALMAGGGGATRSRGMGLFIEPGGVLLLDGTRETPGVSNFTIFGPSINDGVFHHVAATWTGDTTPDGVKLYLDGELIGTTTALTAIQTDATPLYLGDHPSFYFPLTGLIDEPTVYDRVLSPNEILSIYNRSPAGKGAVQPGNGGDGVHIVNASGNLIGGTTDSDRNVISGNEGNGVRIEGGAALPSPVGSWQAEGDATDSAGDNDGEIVGAGFTAGARGGQAFQFDGVDDYVRVPNAPELEPEKVTLSAWINAAGHADPIDYFVAKGGQFKVAASYALYQINGFAYFYVFDGTTFVRSPMPRFARMRYRLSISFYQSRNIGRSSAVPRSTAAKRRPPGFNRRSACSTCLAPNAVLCPWSLPPVVENGRFITMA